MTVKKVLNETLVHLEWHPDSATKLNLSAPVRVLLKNYQVNHLGDPYDVAVDLSPNMSRAIRLIAIGAFHNGESPRIAVVRFLRDEFSLGLLEAKAIAEHIFEV